MKRRMIAIFSIFIILISIFYGTTPAMAVTSSEDWPSGPSVYAESAIIMEASTGLVLYQKNMNDQHYPASITKIMTVLLALENSSLGDIVTVSKNAVYDVDANSSRLWVEVGEQLTMQQCLYAILLESANDVAYAVAEHVGGTVDNFAKMMNEKAQSLGCKNTHFVNPHGLPDDNHYTTAYDMALITREAMKNESFRKIFDTKSYQIPPTNLQSETRYLNNHHDFVKKDGYLYDDCIGGKTGYTNIARFTLVTAAKRGDLELICVVMKDDSNEHQYTDTQKLFDWAFDNFSIYPIADLEDSSNLSESPLFTKYNPLLSSTESPITIDENGYLVLPNSASFKDAKKEVTFNTADVASTAESSNTKSTDAVTSTPTDSAASTSTDSTAATSAGSETTTSADSEDKVIGKISYTYDGKYVGGANILYRKNDAPTLVQTDSAAKNPTAAPESSSDSKSGGSLRPIIIGCIVGLIIISIGLYYFFIERPRLKRRNAYYRKRALRKSYKEDDFLDL